MTLRICVAALAVNAFAAAQAPVPILADGHVHITNRVYWEGIDPWQKQPIGDWDYARAREGGVNFVIESVAPYGYNTYNTTVKHAGRLIETFHRSMEAHRDKMELALTSADVRRITASGKMAVVLGIEAGFDQEGDIDILRLWYRLGVRVVQFASQVTTSFADSSVRGPAKWGGINDKGRALIAEMNRLGMLIDITHATEDAQRQIVATSRAPVIASHVAMRAVTNNPGNMPDDILRAIAAKGGMIGIHTDANVIGQAYYDWKKTHRTEPVNGITREEILYAELPSLRSPNQDFGEYIAAIDAELGGRWRKLYSAKWKDAPDGAALAPTLDDWVEHVAHAAQVAGPQSVALGLDLTNARTTLKDFDASGYPRLVDALRKRGLATPDVLGENWLRMLDAAKALVPLRIAVNTTTIESTPLFVASTLPGASAIFELVPVTNGRIAMAQLASGAVDAATGSETQLLLNSTAQPSLRAVLTLAECYYRIVSRGSSGIRRLQDLKGKKVAATPGTSSLYYLDRMLRTVGLTTADVSLVDMEGTAMPAALASGSVDAISIWEPHAHYAFARLGADAVTHQNGAAYTEHFNLNTTTAVLADPAKRQALSALLVLLRTASEDIRNRPTEARRLVSPLLSIPELVIAALWPQFSFPADLRLDVVEVMTEVEPWAALSQNRRARSREDLALLLDRSLLP